MRKLLILPMIAIFSLFLISSVSATCNNNVTAENDIYFNGTTYNVTNVCNFGCNNATGTCNGTSVTPDTNAMWITFAVGSLFLVLAVILGLPLGKMTEQNEPKSGFDTTMVIKYVFFFVGLFLMYLSISMAYNNVNLYGGESNTLGGINTTLMVMMITIVLFLFVFVIENLFYFVKRSFKLKQEKEWGERES